MPVVGTTYVTKYDRGAMIFLVTEDGSAVDLSSYTVKIEVIEAGASSFYEQGTDAECTFTTDGTDGKVQYNPPSGGWVDDVEIAIWLLSGGVPTRYPRAGGWEVRVSEPGDTSPA